MAKRCFCLGLRKQRVALVVFVFLLCGEGACDGGPRSSQVAVSVRSSCGSSRAGSNSTVAWAGGDGREGHSLSTHSLGSQRSTLDHSAAIMNGGGQGTSGAAGPGGLGGGLVSRETRTSAGGAVWGVGVSGIGVGHRGAAGSSGGWEQ